MKRTDYGFQLEIYDFLKEENDLASTETPSPLLPDSPYIVNFRNKANGFDLVKTLKDASIKAVVLDPQWKNNLDHLQYGNLGKREARRMTFPPMDNTTIANLIREIDRVMTSGAYLFLWLDKYCLVKSEYDIWLANTDLQPKDLITWDKQKMGMGWRTRSQCEYLLVIQKCDKRNIKSNWKDHSIPDIYSGKTAKELYKEHPHAKPIVLTASLINSVTDVGDYVLDPCAGSFTTLSACEMTGRNFIGCDIITGTEQIL